MNAPQLEGAESAQLPFVSAEARRATLSLLDAVGAFESGPKGEWNFVNHRLCEMLGVPASSLLGREWLKMIHPDDVQRAVAEYKQARDAERSWHHELRFRRFDGTDLHVLIDASPMPHDPKHRGVSYLGVVSDVTGEHRAQEIVEESRMALQRMLDIATEGIFVHRNRRVVAVNNAAAQILGYDSWEDLIGRDGLQFVAEEDRERFAAAAASDQPAEAVGNLLRRDGSRVRVSIRASAAMYAGAPARFSTFVAVDSPLVLAMSVEQMRRQLSALEEQLTLPHSRVELRDGEPIVIAANQAYADMVGRPRSEVVGMRLDELVPRELNEKEWQWYEELLSRGQRPATFEVIYRLPDGSTRRGRVHAVDFRDPITNVQVSMSFVVPL